MAITPIRALLFLAGGVAAAAATAYVSGALDPYLAEPPPTTIASLPAQTPEDADPMAARLPETETPAAVQPEPPAAEEPAAAEPEVPAVSEPPAEATSEPATPAAPVAPASPAVETAEVVPPSFDLVRVESDGSIVIAGHAAAKAKVEIVIGSDVVGEAVAGPEGDFAVVLEKPLEPGGYQIVLRSTAPDNIVAMSVETAVVSVPETENGQVLALVEEPGKPSDLISVPEPEAPAPLEQAANDPAAEQPIAEQPASEGAVADQPAEQEPSGQMEAALTPEPESALSEQPEPSATEQPVVTVEAVEIEGRTYIVAGSAEPGANLRGYANEILLGDAQASPGGRFLIEAERDLPVGDYIIRVDVLEPDGVKVAARAAVPFEREPGETIAAVAPSAPATPAGPAVEAPDASSSETPAEPETDVAAAEEPEPTTDEAMAEAAPAEPAEPAPEQAVDAPAPAAEPADAVAEAPDATPAPIAAPVEPETDVAAADAPAMEPIEPDTDEAVAETEPAEPAGPQLEEAVADTSAPDSGQSEAVAEDTPAVTPAEPETDVAAEQTPVVEPDQPGTSEAVAEAVPPQAAESPSEEVVANAAAPDAGQAETVAGDAPAVTTTGPDAGMAAAKSPSAPTAAPGAADASVVADMPESAAEPEIEMAEAPADGQTQTAPPPDAEVPTVTAPKLQSVDSAVIIRRGDTLWRISRRVYGRGIRYSTIYLANELQIEDPDLIWPGQVFTVPEKTKEGVTADLSRMGDQVTTVPHQDPADRTQPMPD